MAPTQIMTEENMNEATNEKVNAPGSELYDEEGVKKYKLSTDPNYRHEFITTAVIALTLLHLAGFYGFYLVVTCKIKLATFLWGCGLGVASMQGIVLGAHRGFSHNAFKLTPPAQIIVIILQTVSGQNHLYWWIRDHRLHHKFVDTDADPYNAKRGFFFSHIGWLMTRKHPLVREKGESIDMSDIQANKFIMFQKKYFVPMYILFCIAIPTLVPVYAWNEDFWLAFFTVFAYRYVHVLNATWSTNSFAHLYGAKSFDARTSARQSSICNLATFGEGWHNYHHAFPWDYALSEFGFGGSMSTKLLHFLKKIDVAYDFKTASPSLVYNHSMRYGDGSITHQDFKSILSKENKSVNNKETRMY